MVLGKTSVKADVVRSRLVVELAEWCQGHMLNNLDWVRIWISGLVPGGVRETQVECCYLCSGGCLWGYLLSVNWVYLCAISRVWKKTRQNWDVLWVCLDPWRAKSIPSPALKNSWSTHSVGPQPALYLSWPYSSHAWTLEMRTNVFTNIPTDYL